MEISLDRGRGRHAYKAPRVVLGRMGERSWLLLILGLHVRLGVDNGLVIGGHDMERLLNVVLGMGVLLVVVLMLEVRMVRLGMAMVAFSIGSCVMLLVVLVAAQLNGTIAAMQL